MYKNCKLAVIGCGNWGFNHVKTAYKLLGPNLRIVCDVNPERQVRVRELSSSLSFTTDLHELLDNQDVDAVIVATPAAQHYQVAKKCLISGKHVLVEKPMTLVAEDAKDLLRIAREHYKILMVGHLLLYHPAVRKIKQLIRAGRIGKLQYIYSNRLNLGTIRSEENILWSFAPHDISIIQHLTESYPIYVDAKGADFLQNYVEDTTFTYLIYPNNIHAHVFVSWLHPFKEHRLIVIGDEGMLAFEDNLQKDKLKLYPKGYYRDNGSFKRFEGDFENINFDDLQPLEEEQKHFFECILKNRKPLTDGMQGLEVLEILERAQHRLRDYVDDPPIRLSALVDHD